MHLTTFLSHIDTSSVDINLPTHLSYDEFVSAICRRNTVEDPTVPKYTPWLSREDPQLFQCACDGGACPKSIDPFGYHFVGCRTGANAIRLHDEVVAVVARLFRSLRLVAIR